MFESDFDDFPSDDDYYVPMSTFNKKKDKPISSERITNHKPMSSKKLKLKSSKKIKKHKPERIRKRIPIERPDFLNEWNDIKFREAFRMTKETFNVLFNKIELSIKTKDWNNAIPPNLRLMITLRYLATGDIFSHLLPGICKGTAVNVVKQVVNALVQLAPEIIKMPLTHEELEETKMGFYSIARFPHVIGTINCSHVRIKPTVGVDVSVYRNNKDFYSKNVQVVASHDFKILDLVTRWPGSVYDQTIFNQSRIHNRFENNEFESHVLLGNSEYECTPYLLTPLLQPQTPEEKLYNESLRKTLKTVEQTIEFWKRRFPILHNGIRISGYHEGKADLYIIASAVLYNFCCTQNDPHDFSSLDILQDALNTSECLNENITNEPGENRNVRERNKMLEYFSTLAPQ